MKFPMAKSPFPPANLSPDELLGYDQIGERVVVDAIAEYTEFVNVQRRKLDRKLWKPVKTRENMTIYREARPGDADDQSSIDRSGSSSRGTNPPSYESDTLDSTPEVWEVPKLLGVGSIVGSFDDVMLGCVAPDAEWYRIKSAYVDDEVVDWRQLATLREGTPSDPYEFRSIKWLVKCAAGASAIVRPRDVTMIDGTGVRLLPNGERVGFFVASSVHVPSCPELEQSHGIVRVYLSGCYLFRAITDNSVEVFMISHMDMGGQLGERLGAYSSSMSLISCWRYPWCGQSRKLSWMLKQAALARQRMPLQRAEAAATENSKKKQNCCPLCKRSVSAFRTVSSCHLCLTEVCSKCMTSRKLFHLRNRRGTEAVHQETASFCKSCLAQATRASSFDVAVYEFVHSRRRSEEALAWPVSVRNEVPTETRSAYPCSSSTSDIDALRPTSTPRSVTASSSFSAVPDGADTSQDDAWQWQQQYTSSTSTSSSNTPQEYQQQLWMQMNQLRFAAEEAYQLTRQNAQVMKVNELESLAKNSEWAPSTRSNWS